MVLFSREVEDPVQKPGCRKEQQTGISGRQTIIARALLFFRNPIARLAQVSASVAARQRDDITDIRRDRYLEYDWLASFLSRSKRSFLTKAFAEVQAPYLISSTI